MDFNKRNFIRYLFESLGVIPSLRHLQVRRVQYGSCFAYKPPLQLRTLIEKCKLLKHVMKRDDNRVLVTEMKAGSCQNLQVLRFRGFAELFLNLSQGEVFLSRCLSTKRSGLLLCNFAFGFHTKFLLGTLEFQRTRIIATLAQQKRSRRIRCHRALVRPLYTLYRTIAIKYFHAEFHTGGVSYKYHH